MAKFCRLANDNNADIALAYIKKVKDQDRQKQLRDSFYDAYNSAASGPYTRRPDDIVVAPPESTQHYCERIRKNSEIIKTARKTLGF